jgi:hypothetical protein
MNSIRSQLAVILDAVRFQNGSAFSFQGESYEFSSEAEAESKLRDLLYERCYMRRIDDSRRPESNSHETLLPDLRAANVGASKWQTGWCIQAVHEGGWVSARRDGLERTFAPGEFVTKEGPGMPLRVGGNADVYFAIESIYMQPGFYFAFGETIADESANGPLLRFYWNVEAAGAPLLLYSVSKLMNRFQVPFRFKCLTSPQAYVRSDAAVIFVPRRWYQIAARLLAEVHEANASHLRTATPLFAKRLADGLGFAEDPGAGQSFGMHRCAAFARALRNVGSTQTELSPDAVEADLSNQGVSPLFPYLNPGSTDIYDFIA